MECSCYALRGAVTVESDTPVEITAAVRKMFEKLLELNNLSEEELAFIHFSQTKDLRSVNAASALRKGGHGSTVPLFCTQEADTEGALEKCIRVLVLVSHAELCEKKMVYLGRAEALRPDLRKQSREIEKPSSDEQNL